ncbi:MAG: hypothetical protein PHH40_02550 [Candidatus Moranbacteria bacterium]|nr:hypothetical protein [Candidatus Moranbacteria bacterium]MDD3965222.1 hypothetical protein [Candidatus Moranbacteria bacterium]
MKDFFYRTASYAVASCAGFTVVNFGVQFLADIPQWNVAIHLTLFEFFITVMVWTILVVLKIFWQPSNEYPSPDEYPMER